jgi:hypothetical protein
MNPDEYDTRRGNDLKLILLHVIQKACSRHGSSLHDTCLALSL